MKIMMSIRKLLFSITNWRENGARKETFYTPQFVWLQQVLRVARPTELLAANHEGVVDNKTTQTNAAVTDNWQQRAVKEPSDLDQVGAVWDLCYVRRAYIHALEVAALSPPRTSSEVSSTDQLLLQVVNADDVPPTLC